MKKIPIALFLSFILLNAGCKKEELNNPKAENGKALTVTDISFVVTAVDGQYFELSELNDDSRILKNGVCSGTISGKINSSLSQFQISSIDAEEIPNYDPNGRGLRFNYLLNGEGIIYTRPTDYFRFIMKDGAYLPANYEAGYFGPDPLMGAIFSTNFANAPRPGSVTITEGYGKFKSLAGKKLEAMNGPDPYQINRAKGTWKLYFSTLN